MYLFVFLQQQSICFGYISVVVRRNRFALQFAAFTQRMLGDLRNTLGAEVFVVHVLRGVLEILHVRRDEHCAQFDEVAVAGILDCRRYFNREQIEQFNSCRNKSV